MSTEVLMMLVGALGSLVLLFGAAFIALWRSTFKESLATMGRNQSLFTERLDRFVEQSAGVQAHVAVLAERQETNKQRLQALADWKHDHCEPAVRYVGYLKEEKPWENP
jgi:hypothetical protein